MIHFLTSRCSAHALLLLFILCLNLTGTEQACATDQKAEITTELISLFQQDQAVRKNLIANNPSTIEKMLSTDHYNAERLNKIIRQIGWPSENKVGIEASKAAFFIAQHAINDRPLMELALVNLEHSFKSGEPSGKYFAMMYDRLKLLDGEPQKYGTQIIRNKNSCSVYLLLDKEKVSLYREEAGFQQDLDSYQKEVCERPE
ncbi:DUF6624 domain-containing protein [Undibacterium sp. Rencai35W]|uniref:DUF6624 domain-containing protein n=1 Tax=Undibacterium sp. Rencai35W TaxID=3413046 RepID=UPI003BF42EE2